MSLVVQKFGGTSLADVARIEAVADRVESTRSEGHDLVVVVSAMGQTTDELVDLAGELSDDPSPREMDMLLSAGERISMALLSIALNSRGIPAVSFTGSQAGILTDSSHGSAKILDIQGTRVSDSLAQGKVVIVAGFQGVDPESKEITTLGRGGSDATAVALAAALGADSVEIFTDVDGVFSADPRIVPEARKLDEVPFDEMLELSASGAGVLMSRAVEFGRRFDIPIHVRSSFHDGSTDISFTVPRANLVDAERISKQVAGEIDAESVDVDADIAKVSLVGAGMKSHPGVAAKVFDTLASAGINIEMISTSTIRISCVVRAEDVDAAVKALHAAFEPPAVYEEVGA
jgi:aspartate kinase